MKHNFLDIFVFVFAIISFASCCPITQFAEKDCMEITKLPTRVRDIDTEICNYYWMVCKNDWHFYQYVSLDAASSLNEQQVKVIYRGKPLKFKMYKMHGKLLNSSMYKNTEWYNQDYYDWKETKSIDIADSAAVLVSFKRKRSMKDGESVQIVERDFPSVGDSLVTSIKIPSFQQSRSHYMSDSSKVLHFLKNNYNSLR